MHARLRCNTSKIDDIVEKQNKKMIKFKYLIILFFLLSILVSCSDDSNKKGKKGDFSFRKCTSCKILDN